MQYTETLDWILDKHGTKPGDEAACRENSAFVHSLGLKCDCVGWSKLDLASPRMEEILAAIERFCRQKGWRARGMYTREYAGESDWYELRFAQAKEDFSRYGDFREVPAESGGTVKIRTVRAFHEPNPAPRWCTLEAMLMPERFREVCLEEGWKDIEFCWAEDKGKYDAPQYFHLYARHVVGHMTEGTFFHWYAEGMREHDPRLTARMMALGGALPRLMAVFCDLMVSLPRCYLAAELPEGGFAGAYLPADSRFGTGRQHILVHRNAAELLLGRKALQSSWMTPVPVLDAFLPGYEPVEATQQPIPAQSVRDELLQAYTALKAADRPIRMVPEKEALKLLRAAKKARKEDFSKALPKAEATLLADTAFAPLALYYLIADGGYLSDEYELLPQSRAVGQTEAFRAALAAEELLDNKPDGVVFAGCPDGDAVLLLADGAVIRFSHEAPEPLNRWPSLAQFVAETVAGE